MRKLYITLALIISSFFLFSSNTYADALEIPIGESNFDYINDEFIKVRNYAIDYAATNNCYYIIYYYESTYRILFQSRIVSINNTRLDSAMINFSFPFSSGSIVPTIINYLDGEFVLHSNPSVGSLKYLTFYISSTTGIDYTSLLDTNFSEFYTKSTLVLTYNDYSYTFDSNNGLFGLYDIYVDIFGEFEKPDIHLEEKTILSNFYILIVDKINILSTAILSNYIYLSVIGIFIFIFLIELIFRRLL